MACENLGVLSAVILAVRPLIAPLVMQGLVLPILPPEMYEVVHSPVPYVVGVESLSLISDLQEGYLDHVYTLDIAWDEELAVATKVTLHEPDFETCVADFAALGLAQRLQVRMMLLLFVLPLSVRSSSCFLH